MIDLSKYDKSNIGKLFDHTCLGKWRTEAEIRAAAKVARKLNTACFGTSTSYWTPVVREELEGTDITAGIAIDFPFGASCLDAKVEDLKIGLKRGATCVDYVVNIGAFKSGFFDEVLDEAKAMKDITKSWDDKILVKAIMEVPYLEDDEVKHLCEILAEAGIDYAKSCSGQFAGPTIDQVRLMDASLKGSNTKVKVAGVKAPKDVLAYTYILAGAELIGSQDTPMIIESLDKMRAIGLVPPFKG